MTSSCCRLASTYGALVKAQKLLIANAKLPAAPARAFAAFFGVAVPKGKSAAAATRAHFDTVQRQDVEDESGPAVRAQADFQRKHSELPVFLLAVHPKTRVILLYSVSVDRVVVEYSPGSDAWELADTVMQCTEGNRQFIVVPVVESAEDRKAVRPDVEAFSRVMRSSGLLPVCHVDSLELAENLPCSPPASGDAPRGAPATFSETWLRANWVSLRTLACKAIDADPIQTVNSLIFPRFDVYVIHLVQAGSRSMNLSLWDPVHRRRFTAKGMLSDVLAGLFSTQSKRLIFLPTNRTDRAILFRCRAALTKARHQCTIVFASEIDEGLRRVFQSEPEQYWRALREASSGLDEDLLAAVYCAAGTTLRRYHRKTLSEPKGRDVVDAARNVGAAAVANGAGGETGDLVPMTEVERWLEVFTLPKRVAAERAEEQHYRQFLAIAFTATAYSAYGRPHNPLAEENYVVAASFVDSGGVVLQPWRKFTSRRQFKLPCLDAYETLVVHDAKQLLLLLGCENKELQRFLRRGGRVWCTMLAEYLLDAQRCRTGSNSLGEVSLKHGVLLPPPGRTGSPADDLPLAFHRRHLLPAAPAVAHVFRSQVHRAAAQCQLVSVAHRMDSLLAMTWIEWAGVHVDVKEADRQAKALASAAAVVDKALLACVPPEVPLDMRGLFDWQSPTQLHAYFFGGSITISRGSRARASRQWTANLVCLCHRYGALPQMVGELHLQRFAAENGVSMVGGGGGGAKLPARVAHHIEEEGSHNRKKYRLVVFDVETTGLNADSDEMIEIAMFDPVEETSFTSLVKPRRPISPRTIEIHHITDAAVKNAPSTAEVVRGLLAYLRLTPQQRDPNEVVVLMGHNVFALDEPMLRRALMAHASDVDDYDGLLFCDSVVLLQALKAELQNSRLHKKRFDSALLEALTSSLRLGNLMKSLRVAPEGAVHRADTDTKALWFVLVNAFGLTGERPAKQRDALLTAAARTLVLYPTTGCFVPSERKASVQHVRLPGVARELLGDKGKLVSRLRGKPFGEKVMESLYANGVKVAGLVLQHLRLERHDSRFLQAGQDRSLTVLHPDRAVHQHIDMTATTTSRTTSAYPSLQNIPKDDKSSLRRLFISRFGAKGRCVEIDYSQLEVVVLAILCRDANLLRDLNNGIDFHVKRAEFFSGLPYKEIYEGYQRDVPKYVRLRKTAKQFSFQRLYGAGVPLLHRTTGIPVKDLVTSIQMEERSYPEISRFHRITRSVALRPNNPGLPTGFIVEMPTGQRMSFRARDVILNLPPLKNYPIQGYGAELAQMMLGRVFRHFVERSFYDNRAFLVNYVHDSVWLDCHVDVLEECVRDTARILGSVHEYVPKHFHGAAIEVPLQVSISCGVDMCSMQRVETDFSSIQRLRRREPVHLTMADLLASPASAAAEVLQEEGTPGDEDSGELVLHAEEVDTGWYEDQETSSRDNDQSPEEEEEEEGEESGDAAAVGVTLV